MQNMTQSLKNVQLTTSKHSKKFSCSFICSCSCRKVRQDLDQWHTWEKWGGSGVCGVRIQSPLEFKYLFCSLLCFKIIMLQGYFTILQSFFITSYQIILKFVPSTMSSLQPTYSFWCIWPTFLTFQLFLRSTYDCLLPNFIGWFINKIWFIDTLFRKTWSKKLKLLV